MYNKVILVGNLTRDIELRYSQSGMGIANTAIATSRKFTSNGEKKEETCFVDITFFARSAEIANQYLRKGSKILVEGRLNFDQWVDQNGQKRSKHSVVVETMQMLDSKGDNQGGGGNNAPAQGGQPAYQQPAQQQQSSNYQTQQKYNNGGRYDDPKPQQQQSMDYDGKPYVPTVHENISKDSTQQKPNPDSVPAIDISEEEIPF